MSHRGIAGLLLLAVLVLAIASILDSASAQQQQQQQRRRPVQFRQVQPSPTPQPAPQPIQHQYEDPEELERLRPKVYETHREISPHVGDGRYRYYVEFSDGLRGEQEGFDQQRPVSSSVKEGSYTTFDENGQVVQIDYIADKDGFRPAGGGAGLPTSPPLPEEHVRAREEILRAQKRIRDEHLGVLRAGYAAHGL